jgi:hypothetical protein
MVCYFIVSLMNTMPATYLIYVLGCVVAKDALLFLIISSYIPNNNSLKLLQADLLMLQR